MTAHTLLRLACIAALLMATTSAEDTVHLKNGESMTGTLEVITEDSVTLRVRGEVGSSVGRISYPNIEFIEFSPLEGEDKAVTREELQKIWTQKQKHLHRPRSNAGNFGLAFAEKLLESENRFEHERAKSLFELIEGKDWNAENHARAKQGRLRSMIALGQIKEAMQEARVMADEAEDPRVLIEAKYVLASAEFDQLKAIEEDNPRWDLDDEIRPKRNEYFNAALDQFLFAYLFYGSEEESSARGLIGAANVYVFAKNPANARLCAEDVVKLYPNTSYRKTAEELIATLTQ